MEKIPNLPYEYDALEPYIDEATMMVHHDKHHQTYLDKLNVAIENFPELKNKTAEELLENLEEIPEKIRIAVRNNGGGYVNHAFFWTLLKKDVQIKGEIKKVIEKKFGSFEKFKEEFTNKAMSLFGSGWTWLVLNNKEIEIMNTSNQDSPLSDGKIPLLTLDLWEHAYYLKYQNRRADYVQAFFNIINWEKVNENFAEAKNKKINLKNPRRPEFEIDKIFVNRCSPRAMSGEEIDDKELISLFESAKWAPSSYNSQPWRFIYAKRNTKEWNKIFNLLADFNKMWTKNAAALVVAVSRKIFEHNNQPSITHSFDTGAAWENLALQGSLKGFVIHGMSGFDYERAKKELEIPENYNVEMMFAVGKKGKKEYLSDDMQKMEILSDRKKISEIVYKEKFNGK